MEQEKSVSLPHLSLLIVQRHRYSARSWKDALIQAKNAVQLNPPNKNQLEASISK